MKLFRFMSKHEYYKYLTGDTLTNNKIHQGRTNSRGFCFLNCDEHNPNEAIHFLSGIVNLDICCIFETKRKLKKTYGIYASTCKTIEDILNDSLGTQKIDEYCTTTYNNKNFKLLSYCDDVYNSYFNGKDLNFKERKR